jgi:hypothetical protein
MVKSSTFFQPSQMVPHSDAYSNEYRRRRNRSRQLFLTDGVLKTWLDGELVVDKTEMAWRQYNNVTIDTLYFSVFFGGSSPSFQAKKDRRSVSRFKIYEGQCMPSDAPSPFIGSVGDASGSRGEKMRPLVDTDLPDQHRIHQTLRRRWLWRYHRD